MAGALALAVAAAFASRGARGQTCRNVREEHFNLQLAGVTIDGVTGDLAQNVCNNTGVTLAGFVNDDKRYADDHLEVLTIREDDGGTPSASPDCRGKVVSNQFLVFTWSGPLDGGVGDGG